MRNFLLFWALKLTLFADCALFVYHHFGEHTPRSTSVTVSEFREHLEYLKTHNFTVIKASELSSKLPDKCAVLTADDAYLSVYTEAFRLIKEYGFPLTVFVTTEGVERKFGAYMSWEMMREMQASSLVEFGNHSHTHAFFVDGGDFETDLISAQNLLTRHLGGDNKLFAYPYGEFDDRMMSVLQKHGYKAFVQHSGAFGTTTNQLQIPRYPMSSAFAKSFATKANTKAFRLISLSFAHKLSFVVQKDDFVPRELNCFYGAKSLKIADLIISDQTIKYTLEPLVEINGRRSHITCTARSKSGGYFWFSYLIINRQ